MNNKFALQSAMEYLMTYGWAILIIAVVLGALFQLGIFNASTFTPKAPPGACHVFRPNGPMTTSFINLQGICNGELPQYAAKFNGQTSYISLPSTAQATGSKITISLWAALLGNGNQAPRAIAVAQLGTYPDLCISASFGPTFVVQNALAQYSVTSGAPCAPFGQWQQYVGTYDGATGKIYLNGVLKGSVAITGNLATGTMTIGEFSGGSFNVNGLLANVQVYNTSLSANEVSALYSEGIGGAPVQLNNLVGWWPLNGDTKDYSGNNNNGVPTAVSFTSSWSSGYSSP